MPGPMGYWPPGQPGPMGSEEAQPSMSVQAQQPQQFPQVLPSMGPRPGMQMDPSVMQVVHLSVGLTSLSLCGDAFWQLASDVIVQG